MVVTALPSTLSDSLPTLAAPLTAHVISIGSVDCKAPLFVLASTTMTLEMAGTTAGVRSKR